MILIKRGGINGKKKRAKKKVKNLTPKQLKNLQDKLDLIERQEESSNTSTGAAIAGVLFLLWIIFKFWAKS